MTAIPAPDPWLRRIRVGWAEPLPTPCPCGATRAMLGWRTCACGSGPTIGGQWTRV